MTARKIKPHLAPRLDPMRDLTRLAIRVVELERQLAERNTKLRATEARNADYSAWASALPAKFRPRHMSNLKGHLR